MGGGKVGGPTPAQPRGAAAASSGGARKPSGASAASTGGAARSGGPSAASAGVPRAGGPSAGGAVSTAKVRELEATV